MVVRLGVNEAADVRSWPSLTSINDDCVVGVTDSWLIRPVHRGNALVGVALHVMADRLDAR